VRPHLHDEEDGDEHGLEEAGVLRYVKTRYLINLLATFIAPGCSCCCACVFSYVRVTTCVSVVAKKISVLGFAVFYIDFRVSLA
jgi:hypothetical protein